PVVDSRSGASVTDVDRTVLANGDPLTTLSTGTVGEVAAALPAGNERIGASFGGSSLRGPSYLERQLHVPAAEDVSIVETSSSMDVYQRRVIDWVGELNRGLGTRLDHRLGLVSYGPKHAAHTEIASPLTRDHASYVPALHEL